jgi:hypothetical protein
MFAFDRAIDTVTGPVIHPQFMNTLADRPTIAKTADPGAIKSHADLSSSYNIPKTLQPRLKEISPLPCNVQYSISKGKTDMTEM